MNTTTEDRLRSTLEDLAQRVEPSPTAWRDNERRLRRDRARRLAVPAAAAAATVAAVSVSYPLVQDGRPRAGVAAGSRTASAAPRETSTAVPPERALADPLDCSPTGPALEVGPEPQTGTEVLLRRRGAADGYTLLCMYLGGEDRSSAYRLADTRLSDEPVEGAALVASAGGVALDPWRISYGVADRRVATVAVVLPNGRERRGILADEEGFPYQAWLVAYPKSTGPSHLAFRDADGDLVERVELPQLRIEPGTTVVRGAGEQHPE